MHYQFLFFADDFIVTGVNNSGTVRVNMLSNLEALVNIFANSVEIISIGVGLVFILAGLRILKSQGTDVRKLGSAWCKARVGALLINAGLITPCAFNWIIASARDANLFN